MAAKEKPAPAEPTRRTPVAAIVGGVAVLVAAGAFAARGAGLWGTPPAPPAHEPATTQAAALTPPREPSPAAPTATPTPAPAPATPTTQPAPAPARPVHIHIQTQPDGAELFLDGRPIANPFDADLPQSADVRHLEARLAGYTTVIQDLALEFPQTVRVRLHHGHGVDDQTAAHRAGGAASAQSPNLPAAPATIAAPTPTPAPEPVHPAPAQAEPAHPSAAHEEPAPAPEPVRPAPAREEPAGGTSPGVVAPPSNEPLRGRRF